MSANEDVLQDLIIQQVRGVLVELSSVKESVKELRTELESVRKEMGKNVSEWYCVW